MRVWHPNTQMSEWNTFDVIDTAEGIHLTDSEGNRMMDAVSSMWCVVWGHSEPELVDAIISQAKQIQHSPLFNLTHRPAERLASMMDTICPGMDHIFYTDNGSTAMEASYKMAVQYWDNQGSSKGRIMGIQGGYHGDTAGAMAVGFSKEFFGRYGALMRNPHMIPAPHNGAPPEEWGNTIQYAATLLEEDDTIAAISMESGAQVAGGARIYPPGFQRDISDVCRRNDTLLILDEVATGLGRLGSMAEYVTQQSHPDIVSYGKMLTGGYLPLAATLCTGRVADAFEGNHAENRHLFHGHTFSGNPLAAAVAVRNLELYHQRDLIGHVRRVSGEFGDMVRSIDVPLIQDIRHCGMLAGIQIQDTWRPPGGISANRYIYGMARQEGLYLRTLGNTILLVPPLAISEQELAEMVSRVRHLIGRL